LINFNSKKLVTKLLVTNFIYFPLINKLELSFQLIQILRILFRFLIVTYIIFDIFQAKSFNNKYFKFTILISKVFVSIYLHFINHIIYFYTISVIFLLQMS
jgi:hypothetical protein